MLAEDAPVAGEALEAFLHARAGRLDEADDRHPRTLRQLQHAHEIPVSSTKSAIGHLLGAAGAVEAIATIAALRNGVAPPTLGLEQPDEGLDLDFVQGEAEQLREPNGRKAIGISNSFGFGGHNAVLVLESA